MLGGEPQSPGKSAPVGDDGDVDSASTEPRDGISEAPVARRDDDGRKAVLDVLAVDHVEEGKIRSVVA